jgi:hypothetical protein
MIALSSLSADAVSEQIESGLKAYKDKNYKVAMDELKYASAAIAKLDAQENNKLLPDAIEGWSKEEGADNSAAMAMLGGGTMTSATYKKGSEEIKIEIIANSPMVAGVAMMLNNPLLAQADKNTQAFRHDGAKGVKKDEGATVEITLLLAGQIMIKLTGNNLVDKKTLDIYLNSMEMKKIKASLLQ